MTVTTTPPEIFRAAASGLGPYTLDFPYFGAIHLDVSLELSDGGVVPLSAEDGYTLSPDGFSASGGNLTLTGALPEGAQTLVVRRDTLPAQEYDATDDALEQALDRLAMVQQDQQTYLDQLGTALKNNFERIIGAIAPLEGAISTGGGGTNLLAESGVSIWTSNNVDDSLNPDGVSVDLVVTNAANSPARFSIDVSDEVSAGANYRADIDYVVDSGTWTAGTEVEILKTTGSSLTGSPISGGVSTSNTGGTLSVTFPGDSDPMVDAHVGLRMTQGSAVPVGLELTVTAVRLSAV